MKTFNKKIHLVRKSIQTTRSDLSAQAVKLKEQKFMLFEDMCAGVYIRKSAINISNNNTGSVYTNDVINSHEHYGVKCNITGVTQTFMPLNDGTSSELDSPSLAAIVTKNELIDLLSETAGNDFVCAITQHAKAIHQYAETFDNVTDSATGTSKVSLNPLYSFGITNNIFQHLRSVPTSNFIERNIVTIKERIMILKLHEFVEEAHKLNPLKLPYKIYNIKFDYYKGTYSGTVYTSTGYKYKLELPMNELTNI